MKRNRYLNTARHPLARLVRNRGVALLFSVILLGCLVHYLAAHVTPPAGTAPPTAGGAPPGLPVALAAPAAAALTAPPLPLMGSTHVITPGSSIYALLVEQGLAPTAILELTRAFSGLADLTSCRPGEELVLGREADGRVTSVAYRKSPLDIFRATLADGAWAAARLEIPHTVVRARISGVVETSLFEAVAACGERDSITLALVDVLAWEVDFVHESRPGDTFAIVVEKYLVDGETVRYGPVLAAEYASPFRRVRAFSLEREDGVMDYFDAEGRSTRRSFLKSPLSYNRISSGYSSRRLHPVTGKTQPHYAIDYAAPAGTPVWTVADGTVRETTHDRANGRKVVIRHPGGYETYYLHLSRFARGIKAGTRVAQKQVIGYVGSSGLVTGPHLDYRLKKRDRFVNPLRESFPRAAPVPPERRREFDARVARLAALLEISSDVATALP